MIRKTRKYIVSHPDVDGVPIGTIDPIPAKIAPIFVYGTLQPGYGLYQYIMKNVISYVPDAFVYDYMMYSRGFPMAVRTTDTSGKTIPNGIMWGTLLYLDDGDRMLRKMDDIELPAGFKRVGVDVRTPFGTVSAEIYEYVGHPRGELVEDSDFLSIRYNSPQFQDL